MFLGPVNIRATKKEVPLKVTEEYNGYRDRTAFLFLLFPCTLLLLRSYIWDGCLPALPVQLHQAWLLFLYTSLASRENVLRVNGSDIRPWLKGWMLCGEKLLVLKVNCCYYAPFSSSCRVLKHMLGYYCFAQLWLVLSDSGRL
ncbi:uncharacterized protein [Elaeis guineensis]|uniref:uncharacterized protein isoform X2 n=1 Tax=Elaeis guineensis var. tenera TaxID=51953 RepID=UPI003C6DB27B